MLAADVEVTEIEPRHWRGWFDLLIPPRVRSNPRWALALLEHGKLWPVIVNGAARDRRAPDAFTVRGRLAPPLLDELAEDLDVDAVVVLERDILYRLHADIDSSLELGSDFVAQALVVLRALKRYSGRGIWSQPALLDLLPPLSYDALQRTFDLLIPDRTSLVAYVFDGPAQTIYSSIIAVKRAGHIQLVTTHLGVADAVGESALAREWRRRSRELVRVIAGRYAPPSLAVFLERDTFYRIVRGPPDQLTRELVARNVIIDPAPAWLLGLMSGATMAAFAGRGAMALARVLPRSARKMATDLATTAQAVMRDTGAHPFALLGFDPIELWHRVRRFYR